VKVRSTIIAAGACAAVLAAATTTVPGASTRPGHVQLIRFGSSLFVRDITSSGARIVGAAELVP
jgi:hypothetical protein